MYKDWTKRGEIAKSVNVCLFRFFIYRNSQYLHNKMSSLFRQSYQYSFSVITRGGYRNGKNSNGKNISQCAYHIMNIWSLNYSWITTNFSSIDKLCSYAQHKATKTTAMENLDLMEQHFNYLKAISSSGAVVSYGIVYCACGVRFIVSR